VKYNVTPKSYGGLIILDVVIVDIAAGAMGQYLVSSSFEISSAQGINNAVRAASNAIGGSSDVMWTGAANVGGIFFSIRIDGNNISMIPTIPDALNETHINNFAGSVVLTPTKE
jgi:hypothetical protein